MKVEVIDGKKNCCLFKSGRCVSKVNPQPLDNFRPRLNKQGLPTLWKSMCRDCEKAYRKNNKDRIGARVKEWCSRTENRNRRRNHDYQKNYGITLEDYNGMFKSQNGCCAICKKHQSEFKQALSVDHDHQTGKVRQLLCFMCNKAIGAFDDDPVIMRDAASYVERHRKL